MNLLVISAHNLYRPILVLDMDSAESAAEVRGLMIDWGYLEKATLKLIENYDDVEVRTHWWWPFRRVVIVQMDLSDFYP